MKITKTAVIEPNFIVHVLGRAFTEVIKSIFLKIFLEYL